MNENILGLNRCVKDCHEAAVKSGWWHDSNGKKKKIEMWVNFYA